MTDIDSTGRNTAVLALSDDFTGCVALAGECRSAGVPALVQAWDQPLPAGWIGVTVIDAQSRLATAATAASRVRQVIRAVHGPAQGVEIRFLKRFDSGLRGHVGTELEAVAEELDRPCVIASAAPALGVSVEQGHHLLNGKPVHETDYGTDPAGPLTSYLPAILRGSTATIALSSLRSADFPEELAEAVARVQYVVLDGQTPADLAVAASAVAALAAPVFLAGTYGLGGLVANGLTEAGRVTQAGVLAVVGSMRAASLAQVDRACVDGAALFVGPTDQPDNNLAVAMADCLATGRHVVLLTQQPGCMVDEEWNPFAAPRLANLAADVCQKVTPTALVLVGGETSAQTIQAAGVTRCRVVAEPWPTVALLVAEGGSIDGVLLVTKSGALGDEAWLSEAIQLPTKLTSGGWASALT